MAMKKLINRPTNKDVVGKKENLKLTQVLNRRMVVVGGSQGSADFYDEHFFGYTDTHSEHLEPKKMG